MIKESTSMEITRLAKEYAKQGHKVFALSMGDTHFTLPQSIGKKLIASLQHEDTHYVEAMGIRELRTSISEIEFRGDYTADEILVVPGVKQGLYYFMKAFEGKQICILEPAWLGYHSTCQMCDKKIIRVSVKKQDWLKKLETSDFDCLMVCSPNNPDGKIFNEEEMRAMHNIVTAKKAVLILDEIYSLYSFSLDLKTILQPYYKEKNVVTVTGFSKGYAATGLRLGCVATHYPDIIKKMNIIHQNTATCANSLAQYAFVGYDTAKEEVHKFAEYYNKNRDLICKLLPEAAVFKPDGGFYYFINLQIFGIQNAEKFCKALLTDKKIALVPGSAYGEGFDSWVRLSYSIDRDELTEGIEILKKYIEAYESKS